MSKALVLTVLLGCGVASLAGCASTTPARSDTAGEYIDDATTTTQVFSPASDPASTSISPDFGARFHLIRGAPGGR